MLIIIGTDKYLREIKPFDQIIDIVESNGWVSEVK